MYFLNKITSFILAWFYIIMLSVSTSSAHVSLEQWQQIDTVDGIFLFRSLQESGDLLPFKAIATLDIPYQKIVMALVDAEEKNSWAPKLKSIKFHNQISTNRFEYSEYYATPWPFFDREFLLDGTVEYKNDRVLLRAQNSSNKHLADTGHLVANVERVEIEIIPLSVERTKIAFTFSGDLGGWIPNFVKNIIQKKWPVRFIQAMERHINNNPSLATPRYQALEKKDLIIPKTP